MREREAKPASPIEATATADAFGWAGFAGRTIGGRYELKEPLGRGGMGEVWRSKHLVTGRRVAVKLLRRSLSERSDMRRRFLREARAAARISHPNVIEILDAFDDDGLLALVMPLLKGEALSDFLEREGPLTLAAALDVFLPLLSAVEAAHQQGIVHRDLKPDNVFLVDEGSRQRVVVLDFGIAKLMSPPAAAADPSTAKGVLLGTLWYMAPEQCLGETNQDHLVDVWALGVILYELLSGRRPFEGPNMAQVMKASLTGPAVPLTQLRQEVPDYISKLVARMLSVEKSARPQSLAEVRANLVVQRAMAARHGALKEPERRQLDAARAPPELAADFEVAETVDWRPTDHAMLSSVRPAERSRFRSRAAGLSLLGLCVLGLVLFASWRRVPAGKLAAPPAQAAMEVMLPPARVTTETVSTASAHATASSPRSPQLETSRPAQARTPRTTTGPVNRTLTPKPNGSARSSSLPQPTQGLPSTQSQHPARPAQSPSGAPRPIDTYNPFSQAK